MESGFEIDGERYEIPTLDTIDLDEERILYVYADAVLQDFAPPHPEADENIKRATSLAQGMKIRNPDFKRALACIAYRRRHRDLEVAEIWDRLGIVSALEVDVAWMEAHQGPPERSSQKPLESKSESEPPTRSTASGSPTESGSGPAVVSLARTGTGG